MCLPISERQQCCYFCGSYCLDLLLFLLARMRLKKKQQRNVHCTLKNEEK